MATICKKDLSVSAYSNVGVGVYAGRGTGSFYINYSVTDTEDRAVINSSAVVSARLDNVATGTGSCRASNASTSSSWNVNGNNYAITNTSTTARSSATGQTVTATLASAQTTITKTHTTQNISVTTSFYLGVNVSAGTGAGGDQTLCNATGTITIGAKASYTVSYDLNGGVGTIPNQIKWHGESLTLTTAQPTKDGYTFKGWATTLANAQAGNADQGATYTGNANITLYAVWELDYIMPTIKNVTVERCLQNGTLDDEGDYASVSFSWTVFRSNLARYYGGDTYPYANNGVSNCTITVGTQTLTPTLTGADGTDTFVVGSGTFGLDTPYDATISITDSQVIVTDHTVTATGTLPTAFFPMDFNADATAVGFFMSAPDAGDGAYFGKDVNIYVDTATASSPDYEITQALTDLGWTDVLS